MKNIETQPLLDRVKHLLHYYDIPEHLSGYYLLAEAIVEKIFDAYISIKNIYAALAVAHGKTVGAISRDLNYAVKKSNKLASMLSMDINQVFASRVISFIAIHIKSKIYPPPCAIDNNFYSKNPHASA